MTKQEIKELMRVRAGREATLYVIKNPPIDIEISYEKGHASATDSLAECLSLAIADLEVIATREILITDLPTEFMWAAIRARSAIAAIESKLKGGGE